MLFVMAFQFSLRGYLKKSLFIRLNPYSFALIMS